VSREQLEQLIEESLPKLSGLKAVVRFDLGQDGVYVVDATRGRPVLADEGDESHCTVKLSAENLGKLMTGRMDPMLAYAMGRIKVSGSMQVAMALVNAIG
jgi:putative sterol carrier protein